MTSTSALFALTLVSLAVGPAPSRPAPPQQPNGNLVLAKVDAAMGDIAALVRRTNVVMKGKLSASGMTGQGRFEEVFADSSSVKFTLTWPRDSHLSLGSNGRWSWVSRSATEVSILDADQRASLSRLFALCRRTEWRRIYLHSSEMGSSKVGDRDCLELRMLPGTLQADTWFVDNARGLVLRADFAAPESLASNGRTEIYFSDWRIVDGVSYPFQKRQKLGDLELVFTYESITHPAELAAELAALPPEVRAALEQHERQALREPPKAREFKLEARISQPAIAIRTRVPAGELRENLLTLAREVSAYASKVGATPLGSTFARYHASDVDTIDLEVGLTVNWAIQGEGRVLPSELPSGRLATTWHVGSYDDLPLTRRALEAWTTAQNLRLRGAFYELYSNHPIDEPDPDKWRIQLFLPIE